MNSTEIVLSHRGLIDPHHPALAVLEVALQAAIRALRLAHPELDADDPPPIDDRSPTTLVVAEIVETGALALLQSLRHYRSTQEGDIPY